MVLLFSADPLIAFISLKSASSLKLRLPSAGLDRRRFSDRLSIEELDFFFFRAFVVANYLFLEVFCFILKTLLYGGDLSTGKLFLEWWSDALRLKHFKSSCWWFLEEIFTSSLIIYKGYELFSRLSAWIETGISTEWLDFKESTFWRVGAY